MTLDCAWPKQPKSFFRLPEEKKACKKNQGLTLGGLQNAFNYCVSCRYGAWFTGAAWPCPDYSMSGATYHLTGAQLYTEQRYSVRAGGSINIQNCRNVNPQTDRGRGYVTQPPDFTSI